VKPPSSALAPRDAALLVGLLAVFAGCFALHLIQEFRGALGWVPMYVRSAQSADDFPRVRSFWSAEDAAVTGLVAGDALLAVDDESLRGAGRLDFLTRIYRAGAGGRTPSLQARGAAGTHEVAFPLRRLPLPGRSSVIALAFVALGALTFWRTRGFGPARLVFGCCFGYALHWSYFFGAPKPQLVAGICALGVGLGVAQPLALRAVLTFPVETASRSTAARLAPWSFALCGLGAMTWAFGVPLPPRWGLPIVAGGTVLWALAVFFLLARNFRRAGPTGRRQIKWVLIGIYLGLTPPLVAGAATLIDRNLWWLYELSLGSVLAIPIGLFIAVSRDHLFDVDRLISAAATYTILSIALVAGLLLGVPRLARATSDWIEPGVSQALLSFIAAALVVGGRARLEARVQRWLFRERTALQQGAYALRRALSACSKPTETLEVLGERLNALLAPVSAVIYGCTGDEFAPVFARGPAVAPSFRVHGALSRALAGRAAPLRLPERRGHRFWWELDPEERGALRAMGTAVLLPLQQGSGLGGFVCLGDKRSGDLYTQADLALLASIADKASDELMRYRDREVLEAERAMSARLRRFVPGAIAEQLERGSSLDASEQIVTVLFVDLRGYSPLAERRSPEAIFSVVSAYTGAVSRLVRAQGGTVVEFNGDGMMVVFGAPDPLPGKERAALLAALSIRQEVRRPLARSPGEMAETLDVGIGIATGPAYVGPIQGADRAIWSALGNTTNLAARLQTLTREHRASVALDDVTYRASGADALGFTSIGMVGIRGRSAPVQVYTLPLEEKS
jgi:class 3 adenylate cyclase